MRKKRNGWWKVFTESLEFGAIVGISFAIIVAFIQQDAATGYSALSCLLILAHHVWEKNNENH